MNRRLRAVSAIVAIVAMLFAPLAMALHACPFAGDMVAAMQFTAAQGAATDDAGAPPMDMAPCKQHCAQAKTSFDLAKPAVPVVAPLVPALRVAALEPLPLGEPAFDSPYATAAGPAPPLTRFTVLRI